MKEIKAYIRRCCVNKLVTALEEAGAPGATAVDIRGLKTVEYQTNHTARAHHPSPENGGTNDKRSSMRNGRQRKTGESKG